MRILILQQPSSTTPIDHWMLAADEKTEIRIISGSDTERPADDLAPTTVRTLVDGYFTEPGTTALLRTCAEWQPDRVVSNSEDDVLRAGQARSLFSIPGQTSSAALPFRDKIRMKRLFVEAGLAIPQARRVRGVDDVLTALTDWKSVVLKPCSGAAAEGVRLLSDPDQARHELASAPALVQELDRGLMMVEQRVEGDVFHLDLVIEGRDILLMSPSRYLRPPHTYAIDNMASAMLDETDPDFAAVSDMGRRLVAGLPAGHGAHVLHLEVFRRPDGQCLAGEVASRSGGGMIKDGVRHTYGVDLSRAAFLLAGGLPVADLSGPSRERLRIGPPTGFVIWTSGPAPQPPQPSPDWLLEGRFSPADDQLDPAHGASPNSVTGRGRALVTGSTTREVVDRIHQLEQGQATG